MALSMGVVLLSVGSTGAVAATDIGSDGSAIGQDDATEHSKTTAQSDDSDPEPSVEEPIVCPTDGEDNCGPRIPFPTPEPPVDDPNPEPPVEEPIVCPTDGSTDGTGDNCSPVDPSLNTAITS